VLYTFHQYIIDIHLHGTPDQVLEDFVYHSLEGNPCVLEFKGHHLIAVIPRPVVKRPFCFHPVSVS